MVEALLLKPDEVVQVAAVALNVAAAAILLVSILFYVLIYTMVLKRRTSQNIVWGGAAGCMPVLVGWAAVTHSVSWAAVILFAVVFFFLAAPRGISMPRSSSCNASQVRSSSYSAR